MLFNFQTTVPHHTRGDLPSLMCEIPPQFLSNLGKNLFLKTHIWADAAGFARNAFGVVGKGPREAGMWESLLGLESSGDRFVKVFGDGGCSEPPCGILHSFSYWYSSACEKHPRKKKEEQQLFPWVFQAAIRKLYPASFPDKNHLNNAVLKDFYVLPSSPVVNKLSFFLLGCDLTCPPRRWTCS